MDWLQAQKSLTTALLPLYGDREAAIITDWVLENLSGWKKIDRILHRSAPLPPDTLATYQQYTRELLTHRPVQYVLHESWFAGMKLYVDENVLIPRPETEELVEWVLATSPFPQTLPDESVQSTSPFPQTILDVGTGSGCIAIALAKKLPASRVHACDLSPGALAVARRNAATQNTPVTFHELDFLNPATWNAFPPITCLVSNPPYIPAKERSRMAPHVTNFEPSQALFVPDDDPLLFYRALSRFALEQMPAGSPLFVEIHEELSEQVLHLFRSTGLKEVTLRQDLQGKDRMVKATT
ncbi:MAG: peptide chain release factor N(5)-glutamine methyltransferase [Bacteroidetes bacterium]|nr:peptide chain release factor N(5)-glutamine methyltransferase [Bacteroidota bacterium]